MLPRFSPPILLFGGVLLVKLSLCWLHFAALRGVGGVFGAEGYPAFVLSAEVKSDYGICVWPPCCRNFLGFVVFLALSGSGSGRARASGGITFEVQRPPPAFWRAAVWAVV